MIQIRALGGLDVRGTDGNHLRSVLSQPRRAALLVYLSVRSGGHAGALERRDALATLFWPDADPSAARRSLRQAIAFLRREVGEVGEAGDDIFIASASGAVERGDEALGVDPAAVQCDVNTFERLLDAGELARAVELYAGDFLASFDSTGIASFERWRDETADHLRSRARTAMRQLAAQATAGGKHAMAAHWAAREVALNPIDEDVVMHAMRAFHAAGERGRALETYESYVRLLSQELDDEPSDSARALADSLRDSATQPVHLERSEEPAEPRRLEQSEVGHPERSVSHPERSEGSAFAAFTARRPLAYLIGAVVLAIATAALLTNSHNSGRAARDESVAIMPFRVDGNDTATARLRQGIVDLLGARVNGMAGVVDKKHAAFVVDGDVVRAGRRVVVDATLRRNAPAPNDSLLLATTESGPLDSLASIADRLAARLIMRRAGYDGAQIDELARKPISEVRDFVDGDVALRAGRYHEAITSFERVVAVDSAFPQAALGLGAAGRQVGEWRPWQRGLALAWSERADLGLHDSLYLVALVGPRYSHPSPFAEMLEAWDQYTQNVPASADGWRELGALLHEWGPVIGVPDAQRRARAALAHALELDSSATGAVAPLMDAAADAGDTTTVRALAKRYVGSGSLGELDDYVRWRAAVFLGDDASRRALRDRFDVTPTIALREIIGMAQVDGVGMEDAAAALVALARKSPRATDDNALEIVLANWALNRGRPSEASRSRKHQMRTPLGWGDRRNLILDALYDDGDTLAATAAVREGDAEFPRALTLKQVRVGAMLEQCASAQWHAWRGELPMLDATLRELHTFDRPEMRNCAVLLFAMDGVQRRTTDASARLDSLDTDLRTGERPDNDAYYANIALARMWEARGEVRKALMAIRRRPHNHWEGPWFLRGFLETEQRLAEKAGDRADAASTAKHLAALK